jgi:putative lipoprotein (rSAM/lipoprotein system)
MRTKINILLGGLIAILSGCNTPKKAVTNPKVVAIYGVPYASYDISGTVLNKKNKPIEGAEVVIKGYNNRVIGDTISTNKQGEFELHESAFPTDMINIVVSDPSRQFKTDSIQHTATYEKTQDGRGFYRGECKIETEIKVK